MEEEIGSNSGLIDMIWDMQTQLKHMQGIFDEMGYDAQPVYQQSFKRRFPIQIQPDALFGMHEALCVETIDPFKEHRVRFFTPLLHDPETSVKSLPFAKQISLFGGHDDCGLVWVPPAGSTLALIFEAGHRYAPFYLGTIWQRDRGPGGGDFNYPQIEWEKVYSGHRKGYLVGPNDESQCLPPWNTENYNGYDIDSFVEFQFDPTAQNRITFPNIYGFKTPEKHMLKMVDGDAKCNRRWKRIEILSSTGNWICLKDDHLHYAGQWANPKCPPDPGGAELPDCAKITGETFFTDLKSEPIEKESLCNDCSSSKGISCTEILGGHPSTPGNPPNPPTKYYKTQMGANPFFKHQNECYPYKGPGTPQNNKADLPQSGMQFLTRSGHSLVMDDSVEEPQKPPFWERSIESFDFGCNNVYLGRIYVKTATGHGIHMIDEEVTDTPGLRSKSNGIKLLTACGNRIEANDHTVGEKECPGCPPNLAGPERGLHFESTSQHLIRMSDSKNEQCSPCRAEGGSPINLATEAFILIRSGYGLSMRYDDEPSQRKTQDQYIQITHPQKARTPEGSSDPTANLTRGPHIMLFQGRPEGTPGIIFLRAGGHSIRQTYDDDIVLVGDRDKNPSDKFTYVSRNFSTHTENVHFRYAGNLHILFAENLILLLAGRDCPPQDPEQTEKVPCLYPVVIGRCPRVCPYTGWIHWTENSLSERVWASGFRGPGVGPSVCDS